MCICRYSKGSMQILTVTQWCYKDVYLCTKILKCQSHVCPRKCAHISERVYLSTLRTGNCDDEKFMQLLFFMFIKSYIIFCLSSFSRYLSFLLSFASVIYESMKKKSELDFTHCIPCTDENSWISFLYCGYICKCKKLGSAKSILTSHLIHC